MLAEKVEDPVMTAATHRATFFRQSGWLMVANIAGGILMWAVHFLSKVVGPNEYGILRAFLWLGWTMILNGVGRLSVAVFAVLVLGGLAAGMLTGTLLGLLVTVGIAIWQTRSLWLGPAQPFDWRSLLRQVTPLLLGAGAFQ